MYRPEKYPYRNYGQVKPRRHQAPTLPNVRRSIDTAAGAGKGQVRGRGADFAFEEYSQLRPIKLRKRAAGSLKNSGPGRGFDVLFKNWQAGVSASFRKLDTSKKKRKLRHRLTTSNLIERHDQALAGAVVQHKALYTQLGSALRDTLGGKGPTGSETRRLLQAAGGSELLKV